MKCRFVLKKGRGLGKGHNNSHGGGHQMTGEYIHIEPQSCHIECLYHSITLNKASAMYIRKSTMKPKLF